MHPFQAYSAISFDKHIEPSNQQYREEHFPHLSEFLSLSLHCLYSQTPPPTPLPGSHQSAFPPLDATFFA